MADTARRLNVETTTDSEQINLRRQYWKLDQARTDTHIAMTESTSCSNRPITCFLYPSLTPSRLYDHLKTQGASDVSIVEWMRRLQDMRKTIIGPEQEPGYAIDFLTTDK